jgi:hypothetical protein
MQSFELEKGGAIQKGKVRRKEKKKSEKLDQALRTDIQKGGAIQKGKVRRKEKKKSEKLDQALRTDIQKGGNLQFHDRRHKYLYENLSGLGARHDSPMCRKMMHTILSKKHPALYNTYLHGRVNDLPMNKADHLFNTKKPTRKDPTADMIQYGGSMKNISHSVNGRLQFHDSEFHHMLEIV